MNYCRYCAYCICGDCYYCTAHGKVLNKVNRATSCKDFILCELGDVDTGKQYKPRESKKSDDVMIQLTLFKEDG